MQIYDPKYTFEWPNKSPSNQTWRLTIQLYISDQLINDQKIKLVPCDVDVDELLKVRV
jgi:hypothetical protein